MQSGQQPHNNGRWTWNPALVISEQRRQGEVVHVVQNPRTGDNYELGANEYACARAFDGERELSDVLAVAGDQVDATELAEFAKQLAAAGLLVHAGVRGGYAAALPGDGRQTLRGRQGWARLLFWDVACFRCERFFARTLAAVRPLLTVPVLLGAGCCVFGGLWILAADGPSIRDAVAARMTGTALLALWSWYAVIVVVHEMAHGYVCAHFGGRVPALGFMVLYGKPCAYCDVSDSWLLPRKSQRIWVMAAGSIVELVLWAIATCVWRLTSPETWLHGTALIVFTVCGLGTVFNFNPLLKFDGYYMLSDAIEIPNLRQRAFRDLGRLLLRRPREARSVRERRLLPAYAIAALVYTVFVLGFMGLRLQGWLYAHWGAGGVLLFWVAVSMAAARPARQGASWALAAAGALLRSRRARILPWLALAGGLLALVRWPLKLTADCQVEPLARIVVRSPIDGNVAQVGVQAGEVVAAGHAVLELDPRDLDFALDGVRAEVRELEARLHLVESGARPEELELARRRIDAATTRVAFDRKAYERATAAYAGDLTSHESVEVAERALRLAEDEERSTRKAYELLRAGARPEEVAATRARLDAVHAEVRQLEADRSRTQVVAPISGRVLTAHVDRLQGRYVERGDSLLVIADLSAVVLQIPVPEKDVGEVRRGQRVRFKARSHPARVFEGEVLEVAMVADAGARQRTVLVQSRIDNPEGLLVAHTSGVAKIYCGHRRLGAVLARRGVRMLRTEFWALW